MSIRQGNIATTLEERAANLLRIYEGNASDEAGVIRWAIANLLRARRGLAEVANLTPDRDIQAVIADALAVDDTV